MSVDIQRSADVADHSGQGFAVHLMFQGSGRKCVAKLVEAKNEAILVEVENGI